MYSGTKNWKIDTTEILLKMSYLPLNVEDRFEPETQTSAVSVEKRFVNTDYLSNDILEKKFVNVCVLNNKKNV